MYRLDVNLIHLNNVLFIANGLNKLCNKHSLHSDIKTIEQELFNKTDRQNFISEYLKIMEILI